MNFSGELAGKQPPANPKPASDPTLLAGTYANDYVGTALVEASGSRLTRLRLGPKRTLVALRHWDGDTYVYEPAGESANPGSVSKLTFARGRGGRASAMTIEYYQQDAAWAPSPAGHRRRRRAPHLASLGDGTGPASPRHSERAPQVIGPGSLSAIRSSSAAVHELGSGRMPGLPFGSW